MRLTMHVNNDVFSFLETFFFAFFFRNDIVYVIKIKSP